MVKKFFEGFFGFFEYFFWNFEFFVDFLQFFCGGGLNKLNIKVTWWVTRHWLYESYNMTSQSDIWRMLIGRRMNMRENAWVGKGWKCVGVKMNGVNKGSSISSSMLMEWFENDVIESVRKRCSDAMTHTLWVILSKNLVFNLALHVVLNILGVSFRLHSFFLRLKMAKLTN